MSILSVRKLVKIYRGRKVVNSVDIEVASGEVIGLLGPNGAGKTTTFYMAVGMVKPDQGQVYLDDQEITDRCIFHTVFPVATFKARSFAFLF